MTTGSPRITTRHSPAGAPPLDCWIDGDVWTIPTAPYKGAHYATFPIALPRRLINLMCPRHVCTVCGEPRRRIVGPTEYVHDRGGTPVLNMREGDRLAEGVNQWKGANGRPGHFSASAPTLGWTDCGCQTIDLPPTYDILRHPLLSNYRRGLVLDPFAGSGTTLAAAIDCGRDAIGIDLDSRNLELARERVGLFLEENDDTPTPQAPYHRSHPQRSSRERFTGCGIF